MRMRGGEAFSGKTGNVYPAGEVIEVEHPDLREALIAGWGIAEEPLPELPAPDTDDTDESRPSTL